jgi:type I restriction-modification system DNA methylase subunit
MKQNPYKIKLLETIKKLAIKYPVWRVFSDFVEMSALAIANSIDEKQYESREKRYLETISQYTPDEQKLFPQMLVDLVEALNYTLVNSNALADILGELFHELKFHSHYKGQFFTPQSVCDFMGAVVISDYTEQIKKHGYVEMYEPCCGSGAMILGFARAMKIAKHNYCTQLLVKATDIDEKCAHMTFVQLSLYGIPAVITHGNTITLEMWSYWYTPVYIIHGWQWREK